MTAREMRSGFATALAGLSEDFTALPYPPDGAAVTPCGFPFECEVDYTSESVTFSGAGQWTWHLVILVSRADDLSGHRLVDELVEAAIAALRGDDTLGGAVSDLLIAGVEITGTRDFGGIDYLSAELTVVTLG